MFSAHLYTQNAVLNKEAK